MSETDDTDDDNEAESELYITDTKEIIEDISVNRKVSSIIRNLHNLSIVSPSTSVCTFNECVREKNKFMLECKKCKRLTHYACTGLPDYQISLFMQPRYSLYICENCVGVIHSDISDNCSTYMKELKNKCVKLEIDIIKKMETIESLRSTPMTESKSDNNVLKESSLVHISTGTQTSINFKTNIQLIDEKTKIENELMTNSDELQRVYDEKTKQKNVNLHLKRTIENLDEQVKTFREKFDSQSIQISPHLTSMSTQTEQETSNNSYLLAEKVRFLEKELEISTSSNKQNEYQVANNALSEADSKICNDVPNLTIDIHNLINDRFDKIEESIDRIITQKLADSYKIAQVEQIESKIDKVINHNESYASKLKDHNKEVNNISNIIKASKNDDLVQEREREKRSANLIIYGISEVCENNLKTHDEHFISSFLDTIGTASRPSQIIRLGKPSEGKSRPVKLVMRNEKDKDSVMSRLVNLKNAEDVYRNLSVRDDYTLEERDMVREWVRKAAEKNQEENTQAWKVRGTPKNGLRLAKIAKRT